MPVHRGGAQDLAAGGTATAGGVEAVAEDRRRWPVRVPLPAGGMGPSVPLPGATLRKGTGGSGSRGGRAVSVVRDPRVYLPRFRDQSGRRGGSGRVVLQPT